MIWQLLHRDVSVVIHRRLDALGMERGCLGRRLLIQGVAPHGFLLAELTTLTLITDLVLENIDVKTIVLHAALLAEISPILLHGNSSIVHFLFKLRVAVKVVLFIVKQLLGRRECPWLLKGPVFARAFKRRSPLDVQHVFVRLVEFTVRGDLQDLGDRGV